MKMEYNRMLKGTTKNMLFAAKLVKLIRHKGIYSTSHIENWIGSLLKAKGKEKFKDILEDGKSKLKIIACDITNRRMLILPEDLKLYGIDPMEFSIAKAVSMSISIPFFFTPTILKEGSDTSIIVDGGLVSNFPVWIFDVQGKPRWPTFGFRLWENSQSRYSLGKTDIISYALDVAGTLIDKNEEIYLKDRDQVRTMNIPTLGVGTVQFNITEDMALKLYNSGYNTAIEFMRQWDFKQYIMRYRS
jgi:NTE family protein